MYINECIIISPAVGEAKYCDDRVRLSLRLSVRKHRPISVTTRPPNFLLVLPIIRGSVFIWRRYDMLCTSGFMDDVVFAHNEPYAGVSV